MSFSNHNRDMMQLESFNNSPTFNNIPIFANSKFNSLDLSPLKISDINNVVNLSPQNQKINLHLTKFVWPKSRTLLSIISKMYKDNHINLEQRSVLKDMIIDHDKNLIEILNEYEISNDSKRLYENIIKISLQKLE